MNLTNNTALKYEKLFEIFTSLTNIKETFFENYKLLPRHNHKMVQINDFEFVVVGGRIQDQLTDEVIIIDAVNETYYLLYSYKLIQVINNVKNKIYEKGMYNIESDSNDSKKVVNTFSRNKLLKEIMSFKDNVYLPPRENLILSVYDNILYVFGGYETINYENIYQKEYVYTYDLANINNLINISSKDYFLKEKTGWNSFSFIENEHEVDQEIKTRKIIKNENIIDKIRELAAYIQIKEKLYIVGGCNKLNNNYFEDLLVIDFKTFKINHIKEINGHFLANFEGGNLNFFDSHLIFLFGKQLVKSNNENEIDYDIYNNKTLIMKVDDENLLDCDDFQYGNNCEFKIKCKNKCKGQCNEDGECICYPGYKGINCDDLVKGCENNCTSIIEGKNITLGLCQFDNKLIRYSGSVYGNCGNQSNLTNNQVLTLINVNDIEKDNNLSSNITISNNIIEFTPKNSTLNIFKKEIKSQENQDNYNKTKYNFIDKDLYDLIKNKYKSVLNHNFSLSYNESLRSK